MNGLLRFIIRLTYYPTLWVHRLMCAVGIWRQSAWVDEFVLLGTVPSARDLRRFAGEGVGAVVNLCEEFSGDPRTLKACGLEQLHLPTLDYHCPALEDLARGVRFIFEQIAAGRKVYVHCKAGRGRSATLVLCYLMASRRIDAAEAYRLLQEARPNVARALDRQPAVAAVKQMIRQGELGPRPASTNP